MCFPSYRMHTFLYPKQHVTILCSKYLKVVTWLRTVIVTINMLLCYYVSFVIQPHHRDHCREFLSIDCFSKNKILAPIIVTRKTIQYIIVIFPYYFQTRNKISIQAKLVVVVFLPFFSDDYVFYLHSALERKEILQPRS